MKQRPSRLIRVPVSVSLSPPACLLLLSSLTVLYPSLSFIPSSTFLCLLPRL